MFRDIPPLSAPYGCRYRECQLTLYLYPTQSIVSINLHLTTMCRLTTTLLFLALSTYVTCSLITERVTKDIPIQDAEVEENSVVVPAPAPVDVVPLPNSVTENTGCAKVGEFCINHKDCCSNACLGFKRRCVSARDLVDD